MRFYRGVSIVMRPLIVINKMTLVKCQMDEGVRWNTGKRNRLFRIRKTVFLSIV